MSVFYTPKSQEDLRENIHIINFGLDTPPQIYELVRFISSSGGRAFLVGGSVRDSILSASTDLEFQMKDFDLEVYGINPEKLKEILSQKYGNVKEVGESFGVYKVKLNGIDDEVDIAIPRTDQVSEDKNKGRGIVASSDPYLDLVTAVKRRDLTINSILYDPEKRQIIDPFGGWYDLMSGVINVTDSETFVEDPLRVLRVAQFASRFGFRISSKTVQLSKNLCESGGLNTLTKDSFREEFDKLLIKGYTPSIGIRFLKDIGYLDVIMPEVSELSSIPQEPDYHPEGDVFTHTMQVLDSMSLIIRRDSKKKSIDLGTKRALMLGALFHDLGKVPTTIIDEEGKIKSYGHEKAGVPIASRIITRLYKNNNQTSSIHREALIMFLISEHMRPLLLHQESQEGTLTDKAIRRFINKCFENKCSIDEILMIVEADKTGRNSVNKSEPFLLSDLPKLKESLLWFSSESQRILSEMPISSKKLLDTQEFLRNERFLGLRLGPWVNIISRCVELDYVDGVINSKDGAIERGLYYFDQIFKDSDPSKLIDNKLYWTKFKVEDPRTILEN